MTGLLGNKIEEVKVSILILFGRWIDIACNSIV